MDAAASPVHLAVKVGVNMSVTQVLSAAAQLQAAAFDLVEVAREGGVLQHNNLGSGETLFYAADGLRLLIEAMWERPEHEDYDEDAIQIHGALIRFLEAHGS